MLLPILQTLFRRDLKRLHQEIELYQNELAIWRIDKDIKNSAGNLTLHLVGNLNTYIGAELGKTGYIRNREQEFSLKHMSRNELLYKIDETFIIIEKVLSTISEASLQDEYPILVFEEKTSTQYLLVHLATHLTYHLGQVNYHRRLLDN
jgi:uncharacterized damage-inducible protein DinB